MTIPTPIYRSPWTAEEDAELRRLVTVTPALSYTQIAVQIGRKRNACIGRAHRLALPDRHEFCKSGLPAKSGPKPGMKRRSPVSPAGALTGTKLAAIRLTRSKRAARIAWAGVRTVLADSSDGCRWPCGDHPFVFCAEPVEKGLPYCAGHARIAYRSRSAA
jgi:GcrA cell cycle regulator